MNSEDEVIFAFANSFIGSSFCSDDGNLRIEPNSKISVTSDLIDAEVYWFPKLKEAPGINRREAAGYIVSHEFAHIASALQFIGYFRENSLLVHIDGGASKSSNSFWYFNDKKIKLLAKLVFLLQGSTLKFNLKTCPGHGLSNVSVVQAKFEAIILLAEQLLTLGG